METAEAMARTRHCVGAWVDTYTFQSPGFDERLGYRIFGTLPSYPGAEQHFPDEDALTAHYGRVEEPPPSRKRVFRTW
jgi:hypothetical protein